MRHNKIVNMSKQIRQVTCTVHTIVHFKVLFVDVTTFGFFTILIVCQQCTAVKDYETA